MKRKLVIGVLLIVLFGFLGYKYLYKDHRDIQAEKVSFHEISTDLASAFSTHAEEANQKFLDKVILVEGKITEIESDTTLVLDNSVHCTLLEKSSWSVNQSIVLKGRVVGYDDLFEQVKLEQCAIQKGAE